jgi:hypothetical protein
MKVCAGLSATPSVLRRHRYLWAPVGSMGRAKPPDRGYAGGRPVEQAAS